MAKYSGLLQSKSSPLGPENKREGELVFAAPLLAKVWN
jgi:hypothetical protein